MSEKRNTSASTLSGGQQQMLALAMVLLHDPEVLVIDELSLGLAPLVVQELLAMIETPQGRGQTIIIVEQSLNVALAVADRAVFLEKGQVRFSGPGDRTRRARRPRPRGVPRHRRRLSSVVIATWITKQLIFNGVVSGLVIGLLAMGIVLVYRSTRVINFAVGNMGLVGASLLALLVVNWSVPFWLGCTGRSDRRHAVRRRHGAGRRAAALLLAACDHARGDDRDRRARAGDHHRRTRS